MEGKKKIRIVFAGGGSGGHIYPGLAVAEELKALAERQGLEPVIYWMGNSSGLDRDIVSKNLVDSGGCITEFFGVPSGKLRRYVSLKNFLDLFKIAAGFFTSLYLLSRLKADCLFSKGGFVSVPPCLAARILHIPYYTHECDFTPGLATRLNAKGARKILLSYEQTASYFTAGLSGKCMVTGNPVRPVFYEDDGGAEAGLSFLGIGEGHGKPLLLVLGGSLGARQINELVTENVDWLKERFTVVHQTGRAFADEHPELMKRDGDYLPYSFIYAEMPAVLKAADIVLSRSGANSIWECAVCRKPMLLVPLSGSGTRGDQVDNARFFERAGAALVLAGEEADSAHLKAALERLLDADTRKMMSAAAGKICGDSRPSQQIAKIVLDGVNHVSTASNN